MFNQESVIMDGMGTNIRWLFFLGMLWGTLGLAHTVALASPAPLTALEGGAQIVLVVDVSPSLKNHRNHVQAIVSQVFEQIYRPAMDTLHLITFSNYAQLHGRMLAKSALLYEIENHAKHKTRRTAPLYGLGKVFELLSEGLPQKAGVLLFISDGEDSMNGIDGHVRDMQRTVTALKKTGFQIFSLYFPSKYSDLKRMQTIARWSETSFFNFSHPKDMTSVIRRLQQSVYAAALPIRTPPVEKTVKGADVHAQGDHQEVKRLKKEMRAHIRSLSVQVHVLLVLILGGLLFLGLTAFFIWYRRRNVAVEHRENLWGVFLPKGENLCATPFELSQYRGGERLDLPLTNIAIKCYPDFHNNQKVIRVESQGMTVKFLDQNHEALPVSHLSTHTRFLRLTQGQHETTYTYQFLDYLAAKTQQSQWDPRFFFGRDEIIHKIKEHFTRPPKEVRHILLSGMGNSGKTWFLKYLHHILFKEDPNLVNSYDTHMLSYAQFINKGPSTLAATFSPITDRISRLHPKRSILFIDEFDNFLDHLDPAFSDSVRKLLAQENLILILAGRKGRPFYQDHPLFKQLVPLKEEIITGLDAGLAFIAQLLTQIGLPEKVLPLAIQDEVLRLSDNLPYFTIKLIQEMLKGWVASPHFTPLTTDDLASAALRLAETEKLNTLLTAYYGDAELTAADRTRAISFRQILDHIALLGKGIVERHALKERLTSKNNPTAAALFDQKIGQLASQGLIREEKGIIMGSPLLFYHTGNPVFPY